MLYLRKGSEKMEKFRFETPTIARKDEAIDYINEFRAHNSNINGTGSLDRYTDNYEAWLDKLEASRKLIPTEEKVSTETYFLVRENDDKIVGMCNIRTTENERIRTIAGHIGYSIRPTERRKGYNKINLYLALKVCKDHGINKAFLTCDSDNPASSKTILSLGGKLEREWFENTTYYCNLQLYSIDCDKTLKMYENVYNPLLSDIN